MHFSAFADYFRSDAGILQLMDDLGAALHSDRDVCMLGGGNPAHIPAVERKFRRRMEAILENGDEFERVIGNYDGPQGEHGFIDALSALLRHEFGWDVGPENIAITNGSQAGFFVLFNLFSGQFGDDQPKRILLPLTPEYIGYADSGLARPTFLARKPRIEHLDQHTFKYHIDFDTLHVDDQVGAICVSRPTNPTGNVLTDEEVRHLMEMAAAQGVPLIIDGAYGTPFPEMIFTQAAPVWNDQLIVCLSLSKLGLPGVRTGIIVAHPAVVELVAASTAIMNLASGSIGPALALEMVRSGEIISISKDIIRPYYQTKAQQAVDWIRSALRGYPFRVHKAEGAMFLWLWLRDLPITSEELYRRLKQRDVLVISGHHFFPGIQESWRHRHECIRVSYAQDERAVRRGLEIIAAEVKAAYAQMPDHGVQTA